METTYSYPLYKTNPNKMVRTRMNKKVIVDSDSDEDEFDDEETLGSEDTDSEEDSDYKPPKKKNQKKNQKKSGVVKKTSARKVIESDTESETEYTDIDTEEEEEMEEEEVRHKVRAAMAKRYPSQYLKKKVSEDKKKSIYKKKVVEESEDEEESEDDDDYEEEGQNIQFIIGLPNGMGQDEDDEDEEILNNEDEDCNSDDEQTFMKETYVPVEATEHEKKVKAKKAKKEKREADKQSKELSAFESEYADLVEMKKSLADKLKKKPDSKSLVKMLDECKDSIKELVKSNRHDNTKNFHKLVNSQNQKGESELEYFKKKMSRKEQMKVMADLEQINKHIQVDKPYRLALLEANIPTKYKAMVMQKLNTLKTMDTCDGEYFKLKNWVDIFMRIPFGKYSILDVNMSHGLDACQGFMESSMKTLDSCVFGLNDAKMQIMQLIGQWVANPSAMGTAIAIGGPPGTGKTTLVKEGISKILNREFIMFALGGATDASYYDGSPYVYEGSGPGAILRKIIEAETMNPCILFDELCKVSDSEKGREIIGLLTHLTDTTQNMEFQDKFMPGVSIDMSRTLFIASYNDEHAINPVLKDRMYRIRTKGYSTKEKITIAKDFLLPKIRQQVSFTATDVLIPDETLEYIITTEGLTKDEDGVRNLKRCLEIIHTKLNLFRLVKSADNFFSKEIDLKVSFPFTVGKKDVDALIKNEDKFRQSVLNTMYV